MNDFTYKDNALYCENVPVKAIADKFPTPFYLYSYATFMDHFRKIKKAFEAVDPLICFSMKSNSNLSIARALVREGAGLDIVSGGELFKALKVGCPADRIVYASVGKTEAEIESAIRSNILFFNVESVPELIMIDTVSRRLKEKPRVALRVNPDVSADTHEYITTGKKENKFGIDFTTAEDIFDNENKYSNVSLEGIHVHIGSQITDTEPFVKAISKVIEFLEKSAVSVKWLNIGGGFGITYGQEKAKTAEEFASRIIPLVKGKGFRLILEPGRFIIGNAGILVAKVLYIKTTSGGKRFAIVNAGMNDLIRPSLYDAYHEITPVVKLRSETHMYDIVGPICESGDFLGKNRELPELVEDEYLAVMSTGAYGFAMASNYNSRPRPAELLVKNGRVRVIRRAETYKDLISCEKMLKELK
ncbi:MAG: diaminopimelate decarboxylase [Candidatus Omnitrophica bacterium]|nr:diaminopimelate decarboxylase [Candidatus Omnitrophota bacterium]